MSAAKGFRWPWVRRSAAGLLERRLQDAMDTFSARVDTTDTDMGDVRTLTKRLNEVDHEVILKLRKVRDDF